MTVHRCQLPDPDGQHEMTCLDCGTHYRTGRHPSRWVRISIAPDEPAAVPRWAWVGLITALAFFIAAGIEVLYLQPLTAIILGLIGLVTGCVTVTAHAGRNPR